MDENQGRRDLDTRIPISKVEKDTVFNMMNKGFVRKAWIVGGSTVRPDSKDIDIIVQVDNSLWSPDNFCIPGWVVQGVYQAYDTENPDNFMTEKHCVIKMVPEWYWGIGAPRPIDLLIVNNTHIPKGIEEYMDRCFPLSIQRRAYNVFTRLLLDNAHVDREYILVNPDIQDTYLKRYKGYYPDKKFFVEL